MSAISNIRSRFATGMRSSSSFSMQQSSASKMASANSSSGGMNESQFAAMNQKGKNFDIGMAKDELEYEIYGNMEDLDDDKDS